eukprot:TRINITY_DN67928_c4_g1_i1.p1 TRINITY_DN67928_c4_g1~~TRINITY_DN67928_c4_g1_i1.p1  ORF type:complete len:461 (+),score=272.44 TRINITY_DN67928_c4_g1_i1:101-1384(+)
MLNKQVGEADDDSTKLSKKASKIARKKEEERKQQQEQANRVGEADPSSSAGSGSKVSPGAVDLSPADKAKQERRLARQKRREERRLKKKEKKQKKKKKDKELPMPMLDEQQAAMAMFWLRRSRRLTMLSSMVRSVIAVHRDDKCDECGRVELLHVEQLVPMDDLVRRFDNWGVQGFAGMEDNEAFMLLRPAEQWRLFFTKQQQFRTRCMFCIEREQRLHRAPSGAVLYDEQGRSIIPHDSLDDMRDKDGDNDEDAIDSDASVISFTRSEIAQRFNAKSRSIATLWLKQARKRLRTNIASIPKLSLPDPTVGFAGVVLKTLPPLAPVRSDISSDSDDDDGTGSTNTDSSSHPRNQPGSARARWHWTRLRRAIRRGEVAQLYLTSSSDDDDDDDDYSYRRPRRQSSLVSSSSASSDRYFGSDTASSSSS